MAKDTAMHGQPIEFNLCTSIIRAVFSDLKGEMLCVIRNDRSVVSLGVHFN